MLLNRYGTMQDLYHPFFLPRLLRIILDTDPSIDKRKNQERERWRGIAPLMPPSDYLHGQLRPDL